MAAPTPQKYVVRKGHCRELAAGDTPLINIHVLLLRTMRLRLRCFSVSASSKSRRTSSGTRRVDGARQQQNGKTLKRERGDSPTRRSKTLPRSLGPARSTSRGALSLGIHVLPSYACTNFIS